MSIQKIPAQEEARRQDNKKKLPKDYNQGVSLREARKKGVDRMSSMIGQGKIKEVQAEGI